MIGTVVGGIIGTAGVVATVGAAASVWRGAVRGVGRLVEGDPVAALKEVGGGIVEPALVAGTQIANLWADAANVAVYAGAKAAGLLSPQARELVEKLNGFDGTLGAVVLAATMPKYGPPPAPAPVPATVPAAPAGRDTRAAVAV